MDSVEFLLRLLERDGRAYVTAEDLDGPHRQAILVWQRAGFIAPEPSHNPAPTCPHCAEGMPYRVGDHSLCSTCGSEIGERHLLAWTVERETLLHAVARQVRLRDDLRLVEPRLWHLGTATDNGRTFPCFYCSGPLSDAGRKALGAFRHTLVLTGPAASGDSTIPGSTVPLAAPFRPDGSLASVDVEALLCPGGAVRFEVHSGALWAGNVFLGEVTPGSKEFAFLECLYEQLDHFVPYRELKREVLRRSGSTDETEEATFCHALKRRLKRHGIAELDALLATTNKGDGYQLRRLLFTSQPAAPPAGG
jgi:hypothetical protein